MNQSEIRRRYKKRLFSSGIIYCAYCAIALSEETATIDHVVPRHLGGKDRISNYLISCAKCNHQRGKETYKAAKTKKACFNCNQFHKGSCKNKQININ